VLIDPGDEVDELLAAAFEADVEIQRILLTHAHCRSRHRRGRAKEALDVPVHLHRDDLFLLRAGGGARPLVRPEGQAAAAHRRVLHGSPLGIRRLHRDRPSHARHCPGGVCLRVAARRAAGPRAPVRGRHAVCRLDRAHGPAGGDYDVLLRSITGVLFPLGDDAIVHPGHGPDTTIARDGRPTRSCWNTSVRRLRPLSRA
jgi:glyoxylase-like metal-dependent hydrolase (beta-lactamase superfamily II)